jgi:hypothetical protein
MRTLPIELINETLCYLPLNELWRHFKRCKNNADPMHHIFLSALRRSHKFDLSHTGFEHELTVQLAELENRVLDGRKRRDNHKNTCIDNIAKHDAKAICKYFDQAVCSDGDQELSLDYCMDTLIFHINEVAIVILRQCLDMTRIPTTLVTLHFKICQYLLSPWVVPMPRTYSRLYRFLRSLPYEECETLYSKLECSLWNISHEAFMIMMKRHINLQPESVISQTSAFEKDKIFGRYILNSHCTQDSLLRLSCVCGSILNLGGGMINEFKVPDDSPSMFGLCLSVCVGTTTSMAEKILASCCILCFLIKCDNARNSIPSLKKGISSSWEDLLKTWERSSRSAPHYSLELELIFKVRFN